MRFDEELPAVQMRQYKLEAAERLHKGQRMFVEKVVTLPLKLRVFLLLQDKDNISCDSVRLPGNK